MPIIDSIRGEYQRYKALGDAAIAQLGDEQLTSSDSPDDNSIAVICWHVSGNLKSRFTDFLTTDGEKPWRDREEEFAPRLVGRQELLDKWQDGWNVALTTLGELSDAQLFDTITIRRQPLTVHDALHRSLAHAAYHVGQIVYLAKAFRGPEWRSLTIARGQSAAYNRKAGSETPGAHAAMLKEPAERESR